MFQKVYEVQLKSLSADQVILMVWHCGLEVVKDDKSAIGEERIETENSPNQTFEYWLPLSFEGKEPFKHCFEKKKGILWREIYSQTACFLSPNKIRCMSKMRWQNVQCWRPTNKKRNYTSDSFLRTPFRTHILKITVVIKTVGKMKKNKESGEKLRR